MTLIPGTVPLVFNKSVNPSDGPVHVLLLLCRELPNNRSRSYRAILTDGKYKTEMALIVTEKDLERGDLLKIKDWNVNGVSSAKMIFRIEEFEVETKNYPLPPIGATKWMHGQPFDLPTLVSAPMRQEQSGTGFSCNICLETMTQMKRKGKKIVTTPCGHPFCKSCVEMAARSAYGRMPDPNHAVNNCPKCRKAYALRQLIELFM